MDRAMATRSTSHVRAVDSPGIAILPPDVQRVNQRMFALRFRRLSTRAEALNYRFSRCDSSIYARTASQICWPITSPQSRHFRPTNCPFKSSPGIGELAELVCDLFESRRAGGLDENRRIGTDRAERIER